MIGYYQITNGSLEAFIHFFLPLFLGFQNGITLCSLGWSGTSADQAGLKLRSYLCFPSAETKGVHSRANL